MSIGLTRVQLDCLRVIAELTALDGRSPSLDEIAAEMCLSSKARAQRIIDALVERGRITRRRGAARGLEVVGEVVMPDDLVFVGFFDAPRLAGTALAAAEPA